MKNKNLSIFKPRIFSGSNHRPIKDRIFYRSMVVTNKIIFSICSYQYNHIFMSMCKKFFSDKVLGRIAHGIF